MKNSFLVKVDEKVTTWLRHSFIVDDCESEEEAIHKIVESINKNGLWGDDLYPYDVESLSECEEGLEPEQNGGDATIEIFKRNGDLIWDNVKGFIKKCD